MSSEDATPTLPGSSPTRPLPAAGESRIGKYVRRQLLGRGGMGSVYLGFDTELKRPVALKFLAAVESEEDVQRFLLEAQTAAKLRHPNIAAVYDVGRAGDKHYIAMEFVDGVTLDRANLKLRRQLEVMRDAALAVHHANAEGIVHRDLKPANLMIDKTGRVFVMDFGLARFTKASSRLSVSGTMVGTPGYMPPEQAQGRLDIDARADVYSLGATLYALAGGRPPFVGDGPIDTALKVLDEEPMRLRKLNPRIPPDVQTIVMKAMEKDRERRYATAADLAEDLRRFLDGEAIHGRPASVLYRVRKRIAKHRGLAVAAVSSVLLLAALAVVGTWYLSTRRQLAMAGTFWATHLRAQEFIDWAEDRGGQSTDDAVARKSAELDRALAAVEAEHGPTPIVDAYRIWFRLLTRDPAAMSELDALCAASPDEPFAPLVRARCRFVTLMRSYSQAVVQLPAEGPIQVRIPPLRWPPELVAQLQEDLRTVAESSVWSQLREGRRLGDLGRAFDALLGARHDEAIALLDDLAGDPACGPEARKLRAVAYLNRGDFARAAEALEDAAAGRRYAFHLWRLAALVRLSQAAGADDPRPALRQAIGTVDRAIEQAPEVFSPWSLRGLLRRSLAEAEESYGDDPLPLLMAAQEDYERALQIYQRDPELLRGAGTLASSLADADPANQVAWLNKAVEAATRALERDPDDAVALNNRADSLRKLARLGLADARRAMEDFDRALALGDDPTIRSNRAQAHLDAGDPAAAIRDCDAALALDPRHARALVMRASARVDQGDPAAAISDLDAAIAIRPRYALAYSNRAEVRRHLAAGARDPEALYRAAAEDFTRALEYSPRYLPALLGRAMTNGEWAIAQARRGVDSSAALAESQRDFSRAADLAPKIALVWTSRGTFHLQCAQMKLALRQDPADALRLATEDLTAALELNPADRTSRANRATARAMLGEAAEARGEDGSRYYREALPDYDRLVEAGFDRTALFNRATILRTLAGDERDAGRDGRDLARRAIADAEAILQRSPGDAPAHQVRVQALEELAKAEYVLRLDSRASWEAALNAADEFVRAHPRDSACYQTRALLLRAVAQVSRASGQDPREVMREALKDWADAIRLQPRSVVLLSNRGDAWKDLAVEEKARGGAWREASASAIADYRAALEIAPTLWQACANIGLVLDDAGDVAEAVQWLQRAVELNPSNPSLQKRLAEARARMK